MTNLVHLLTTLIKMAMVSQTSDRYRLVSCRSMLQYLLRLVNKQSFLIVIFPSLSNSKQPKYFANENDQQASLVFTIHNVNNGMIDKAFSLLCCSFEIDLPGFLITQMTEDYIIYGFSNFFRVFYSQNFPVPHLELFPQKFRAGNSQ